MGLSCADEDPCVPGYEGCACSDDVCLDGLRCLSGRCVDPGWTPSDDGAGHDGSPGDGNGSAAAPPDNVSACNALVEELDCGGIDLSSSLQCSLYADYPCDIVDYFECIRDTFECTAGGPDTSGLVECAEMATCE